MEELRAMLVAALADAGDRVASAREIYSRPYSSHDSEVAYHEERGRQRGLGKAVEILDWFIAQQPVTQTGPENRSRLFVRIGYRSGKAYYETLERFGLWLCTKGWHRRGLLVHGKPETYRCARCEALYEPRG